MYIVNLLTELSFLILMIHNTQIIICLSQLPNKTCTSVWCIGTEILGDKTTVHLSYGNFLVEILQTSLFYSNCFECH